MWWFSDYDGTININHNDMIDERDLNWIKKWKKHNKFAIATGRILPDALALFRNTDIDFDYLICCNGATIYKKNSSRLDLLKNISIPIEDRVELKNIFNEIKDTATLSISILDKRVDYSIGKKPKELYENTFLKNTVPKINNYYEGDKLILESKDLNIAYIFVKECDSEYYKNLINSRLKYTKAIRTHKNVIEIVNKKISKAYAIEQIMPIENFTEKELVTSGDGENDIEMLELATYSFVMENHQPNVINHAKYMIKNVYQIEEKLKELGVNYE